jgi:predicted permease
MRTLRRFLSRLAVSATRRRDEERLREEVEEHLALQTAENVRAGLAPVEARRQAVLKFGAVEAVKEHYREEQGLPFLDGLAQDLRYALRQLRKAPLFTATATLSLAVGIGANAAIFTLVDRVLLRALPVSNPQELVFVADQRSQTEPSPRFSYPFYAALRDNNVLTGVAARYSMSMNATMNEHVARVSGELISGNYFSVVGTSTQVGRPFTPEDDRTPGAHAVAVISDGFWRRSFGSDPSVLGRDIRINDQTFTIIGVAARGFTGTDLRLPTDIWLPMAMQSEVGRDLLTDARTNWLEIIGRLKSGVSPERAGAELTAYVDRRAPATRAHLPGAESRRLILLPGGKGNSGARRELGPALRVLLVLTALGLVLACVNVASLLVVRSVAREKEIAVRLALGARRSNLTRQFLTETLLLAALGGTAGLLMAPWAAGLLAASHPYRLGIDASVDMRMFLFGLAAWVVTGVLVGQAPILAASNVGLAQAFGHQSETTRGPRSRMTVHDVIVTCQIAVSLVMLIGAGLFVERLRTLSAVDPGFRADDLLLISVDPGAAGYDGHRLESFWRDSLDRVGQLRGVQSVSAARTVPLAPGRQRQPVFHAPSGASIEIDTNVVGPQYFRTLGIPLLRGREFGERDGKASGPVVIVNERMARMFWPGQDPLGKRVPVGRPGSPAAEIVGIVKDVKYRDLRDDAGPMLYVSIFQSRSTDPLTLHVRATSDLSALTDAIRRELQALDPRLPLFGIRTLEDQLTGSFAQTRQAAVLTGGFGMLALLLSAIGVYGVTALAVSRQTRDIGVRMALGAQPHHIARVMGRRGLTLVAAGLSLGLLGAFGFTRIAGALLYGLTAGDSATFAGMSALLAVVSLTATYIPARAATRLDAVSAIRSE